MRAKEKRLGWAIVVHWTVLASFGAFTFCQGFGSKYFSNLPILSALFPPYQGSVAGRAAPEGGGGSNIEEGLLEAAQILRSLRGGQAQAAHTADRLRQPARVVPIMPPPAPPRMLPRTRSLLRLLIRVSRTHVRLPLGASGHMVPMLRESRCTVHPLAGILKGQEEKGAGALREAQVVQAR